MSPQKLGSTWGAALKWQWYLLQQQLNLTLLAIGWILTYFHPSWSRWVWETFFAIEAGLIVFGWNHPQLFESIGRMHNGLPIALRQLRLQPILSWALFIAVAVFVVLPSDQVIRLPGISDRFFTAFYAKWEITAIGWNVLFAGISFFSLGPVKSQIAQKSVALLFFWAGWELSKNALNALARSDDKAHLSNLLWIASCYLVVDVIIWVQGSSERRKYLQAALYADLPTVVALGLFRLCAPPRNTGIFLSGAIAFQFMASSFVLALLESNLAVVLTRLYKVLRDRFTLSRLAQAAAK
jgi:hypothetical protein